MNKKIILGSSSKARKAIMDQLGIKYQVSHPDIDESPKQNEPIDKLVSRLAFQKAVAINEPNAFIIAADQLAQSRSRILGKPLNEKTAFEYLKHQSGNETIYTSAICLLDTETGKAHQAIDRTHIQFRNLSDDEIWHYIKKDHPLHCAGAFKCESLGMLLVDWVHCEDIHGLMGLSIITLRKLFKQAGVNLHSLI